jgi:hypothetical protein
MRYVIITVALLTLGCAKVENPNAPSSDRPGSTTTTTVPVVTKDNIEFRVFGSGLLLPANIRFIDPLNGLTIVTASPPYFAGVQSTDSSVFLFCEAQATAFSTGNLQVQIFVNGKLFREAAQFGSNLDVIASGTFRR